jgi:LysM repeat protein
VTNWTDVGWDTYYDRTSPGGFQSYVTNLMAEDDYITVYLRAWKKWGVPDEEIDINFDAVSLTGPSPDGYWAPPPQTQPQPIAGQPVPVYGGACVTTELVANGSFEQGFNRLALGHVGKSWGAFTNGGGANYGFYDEQWAQVVADGAHGQLIEINSKGIGAPDPDRYAGLYQHLDWLQPGQSYDLTIKGVLRGVGNEEDAYRFGVQWGWNAGNDIDWSHVGSWQTVDFGPIQSRTEPTGIATYTYRFTAPASDMVLFIRGVKRWGVPNVEMDLNLDAISVRGCMPAPPPVPAPVPVPVPSGCNACNPCNSCNNVCAYTVDPGNTLGWIAQQYGVSVDALMAANGISNPNLIYVGQVLTLPGCGGGVAPAPVVYQPPPAPAPAPAVRTHVVQPGETFSYICNLYQTDGDALAAINGITNRDWIYVGQVLKIPG